MNIIILGVAIYPPNQVWPQVDFLARSIKRNSSRGRLAVITSALGDVDRRQFKKWGVAGVEIAEQVSRFDLTTAEGRVARQQWILSMFVQRHGLYLEAIEKLQPSHVLLADTRDVIVTADFDERSRCESLVLSQEAADVPIRDEPWNRNWVLKGYGEDGLRKIGHNPVLCAGCVYGPLELIRQYLHCMKKEGERLGPEVTREIGDQPMHNYLAYTNQLPHFRVSSAEEGWIRSIAISPSQAVRRDWGQSILDASPRVKGHHAVVVHQYDRHMHIRAFKHAVWRKAGLPVVAQYRHDFLSRGFRYAKRRLSRLFGK